MSKIYRAFTYILVGIVAGIVFCIKYIAPPGDEIKIGKIKVKGRGNTANTTVILEDDGPKKTRKEKRAERKAKKATGSP